MTIDEAYRLVDFVANKTVQQGFISPNQFNTVAPIAQLSIINKLLGNEQERPNRRYGFLIDQKNLEELRPLIKIPSTLAFSNGIGTYPTDSLYLFNIVIAGAYQPAEPCEYDEAIYLQNSVIKPPTTQYPKYYVLGGNIYILPGTITTSQISYVRQPLTPKWNYTIVNQAPVYSASGSQDFEVGVLTHLRICALILQMCGINLSLPQVTAFAMELEQSGA